MGQFLLEQQVPKIVPHLIITQMFWGCIVVFRQTSDAADVAFLSLLGEPKQLYVFDEFVFDWISHDLSPWLR